jgi:hypothetical protein
MQFTFCGGVPLEEARATLRLAEMAVESLFGAERVSIDAAVVINYSARQFVFDVSRRVGRTLALVFAGYVRREFGAEMVVVEHMQVKPPVAAGVSQ